MDQIRFKVLQAAYHRNGISGEGFFVGVVNCQIDGKIRQMLISFFPEQDKEGETLPAGKGPKGWTNPRISVIAIDRDVCSLAEAWRGDNFCHVADAIVARVHAQWDERDRKMGLEPRE